MPQISALSEPASQSDPREAILAQARIAFVEKGLDGASMQDLARAAGMSAGNFYRYFPSKAAIVEALVARELDQIDTHFAMIQRASDPMAAIRLAIRTRIEVDVPENHSLWTEIVAAAHRRPEIAAALLRLEETVRGHILSLFALLKGQSLDMAAARYDSHARFVMLLIRGLEMENCLGPITDPGLADMVFDQIERVFATVLSDQV